MFAELTKALTEQGTATLEVTPDRSVSRCRTTLIEAARRAGVRVSMKRHADTDPDFVYVRATVLTSDEAELQMKRDVVFRAVNRVRGGLEILTAGTIETEDIEDEIEDLRDVAQYLEDYARQLVSGVATR